MSNTLTFKRFDEMPVMTKRTEHSIPEFQRLLTAQPIDNPIYSMMLEAELNLAGVEIRAIVSHLRVSVTPPFIGSGANGYFHARKAEDLDSTIDQIEARITRLQRVAKGLKLAQVRLRCGDTQTRMEI